MFVIKKKLNMFSADTLKTTCEQTVILLKSSSKWVDKQTHDKITKDRVGCFELTSMVVLTKNH